MNALPFLFFSISGGEIVVVILIVIMFFGANRIPEIARGIGKGIREVRNATEDIKSEINKSSSGSDIQKFKEKIEKEKKDIEEITGSIKRNKF